MYLLVCDFYKNEVSDFIHGTTILHYTVYNKLWQGCLNFLIYYITDSVVKCKWLKKLFYFQLNSLAPLTVCVVCVVMLFVLSFVVVLLYYIVMNTTKSAFTTWMWCAVFLVVFKSSLFCVNKYHSHHRYIPSIEYDYDTGRSTLFGYQKKSVKFEIATLRRAAAGWV